MEKRVHALIAMSVTFPTSHAERSLFIFVFQKNTLQHIHVGTKKSNETWTKNKIKSVHTTKKERGKKKHSNKDSVLDRGRNETTYYCPCLSLSQLSMRRDRRWTWYSHFPNRHYQTLHRKMIKMVKMGEKKEERIHCTKILSKGRRDKETS